MVDAGMGLSNIHSSSAAHDSCTTLLTCQIRDEGLHFGNALDKDERLLQEQGDMDHPVLLSVLYLCGNFDQPMRKYPLLPARQWP